MKTTVEIPNQLMKEAKQEATQAGTTVKALIQEGLRRLLAERKQEVKFKLRNASFKGKGTQLGSEEGSWEHIREMIYEGRGA